MMRSWLVKWARHLNTHCLPRIERLRSRPSSTRRLSPNRSPIERLEDRTLLTGGLTYHATTSGVLTLQLIADELQIIDSTDPTQILAATRLSDLTSGVHILTGDLDVDLRVDVSVPTLPGGILFEGGTGYNRLLGPSRNLTWTVSSPGAGHLESPSYLRFRGVEQLVGASHTDDTFVFTAGGTLVDGVVGGDAGFDVMSIAGNPSELVFTASGPDSGIVYLNEVPFPYTGLEPIDVTATSGPAGTVTVQGNLVVPNQLILERNSAGKLQVRSLNGSMESVSFDDPQVLKIQLGLNNDTLTISSTINFAGSLQIDGGLGNDTVTVSGNVTLPGKSLRIDAETITVGATLSTQPLSLTADSGSIHLAGQSIIVQSSGQLRTDLPLGSTAAAGKIELVAAVTSVSGLSPIDVFPSPDPTITLQPGAQLRGGEISLNATKRNQGAILPITLVSVQQPSASITVQGATLEGDKVSISATSEDMNFLEEGSWATVNNSLIDPINTFISNLLPTLVSAASVMIRKSASTVTLQDATIISRGDVEIGANTKVESKADAGGGWDPTVKKFGSSIAGFVPLAVAYSEAQGTAKTILTGSTSIAAAGDVAITSNTETKAEAGASTNVNTGTVSKRKTTQAKSETSFGASVAVTWASTVANTEIGSGVLITADGNVDVTADGKIKNQANGRTGVYIDGSLGSAVSVAMDTADIKTLVNGTIRAGSISELKSPRVGMTLSGIDPATNIFTLANHGFSDGQKLLYLSQDPTDTNANHADIGGLVNGQTYFVRVLDANRFQLIRGQALTLDASRIDPNSTQSLTRRAVLSFDPATQVDPSSNTLNLPNHGFTEGQLVEYYLGNADGEVIGGLENQTNYFVHVIDDDTIQLMTDEVDHPASLGPVVVSGTTYYLLNLSAPSRTETRVTFAPDKEVTSTKALVDLDADAIIFEGDHNFATGQRVVYSSGGTAIGGLVNGGIYYVIKLESNSLKLATSEDNANVGLAINLTSRGTGTGHSLVGPHQNLLVYEDSTREFTPRTAVGNDGGGGTITFDAPHNWQTGDAVVYRTDSTIRSDLPLTTITQIRLAPKSQTFNPAASTSTDEDVIDPTTDTIFFDDVHYFVSGQRVVYSSGGGTPIGGLVDGGVYYILTSPIDPERVQLALRSPGPGTHATPVILAGVAYYVVNLTPGVATGTNHKLTGDSVDLTDNLLVVPDHSFFTGQKVVYQTGGNTPLSAQLTDGGEYYVIRVDANRLRLALTRTEASAGNAVTLQSGATGSAHNLVTTQSVTRVDVSRTAAVLDTVNETIELPDGHGLVVGSRVVYSSEDGLAIPGLTDDAEYEVLSVVGNRIQLTAIGGSTPIDLQPGGTIGLLGHRLTPTGGADLFFDPTAQPTIDADSDRLWMPGNRFRDGERITYLSGGNTPIPGLVDGRDYLVTPYADGTVGFTDALTLTPVDLGVGSVTGLHGFERVARGVRYDSAIDGLVAGEIYYVTRVDATTIRLSSTILEAYANDIADVSLPGGQPLTNRHSFESPVTRSGIQARLAAENTALAQSRIGGTPTLGDLITGEVAQDPKTAKKLLRGAKGFMGLSGSLPFSINASVGVSTIDHDVLARIGPNAVLASQSDLTVKASIEQKASINVDGSVTTENAQDGKKVAISAAVARGYYDNNVQALVDGGAALDASGTLTVASELNYPLLIDNLPFSPLRFNINDPDEGNVADELGTLLGGTGGLTRVMNVWASATGRTPDVDVTITGSVALMNYINRSEAIIGAGARINQDPTFHGPAQKVEVSATTTQVLISVAGNIHVELNDNGILNAARGGSTAGKSGTKTWRSSPISLFGNQAKTVGLGGSILIQTLENHTIARIDEGALVRTGSGGLSVTANENVYSFELAQTGGDSGLIGVSGSVSVATQTSETVAQVRSGVRVVGGSTLVSAKSQVDHINITGAVQLAKMVGVGVSVGVTDLTRHTLAIIGNRLTPSDSTIGSAGTFFDVADLTIKSESTGAVWGVGVAGAIVSDLAGTDLQFNGLRGQQPAAAEPVGVGVSGTAVVNTVRDTTQAYLNDNGIFQTNAGAVLLDSANRTNLYALSGAMTLVFDKPAQSPGSKTAIGVAGSFSWNTLEMTTEAFLIGGHISGTNDLKVSAFREGQILAISAGISGVAAVGSGSSVAVAAAGSVTVNAITNATRAYLDRVQVSVDGPIRIESTDKSRISAFSIAGAGAGANSSGGLGAAVSAAGSVAINSIDNTIDSSIRNSPGSVGIPGVSADGALDLLATDETRIFAVSGALAISVSIASGSGLSVAGGVGISVALNDIGAASGHSTRAYIDASNVQVAGNLTLDAHSTAVIQSIAIAGVLAGAGSSGAGFAVGFGGAAAGSRNTIKLNLEAGIRNGSSVTTTAGGQIALSALDRSQILSDTGGISVVVAAGTSGGSVAAGIGGAIALNILNNTVTATIDSSTVRSAGSLSLTARSQKDPTSTSAYRIDALAFGIGAAGSGSAGAGLSGAFAGAGAVAINKVDNAIEASIRNSAGSRSVQSLGGPLAITASDDTSIRADSGGVALAAAAVAGTGTGASAALGASYSENQIGKLSGHSVHALIDASNVTANGNVVVESTSTAVIHTLSIGGSVAVSAGSGMASGAGAGAGALTINGIVIDLASSITGGSVVTTTNFGDILLTSTDSSEILADAGAVAVAIAVALGTGGGASASGSLGAAYAENSIANKVRATIDSSTARASGDVALTATSAKLASSNSPYRIDALALGIAASVTVTSTPGLTGAFAGAGSAALNRIDNTIEAVIRNARGAHSVEAVNGSVTLSASDDSPIRADTGGFALGLAVPTGSGSTGIAASLGGSYSENQIGNTGHFVRAVIDSSRVTSFGPVQLTALSTATINTLAMGGSVAVTGGSSLTSVAVAGAAAATQNRIAAGIEASIKNGSVVTTQNDADVILSATDRSEIVADAGGIAVAVAASSASTTTVSVAVGAGIALNSLANTVQAYVDASTISASGDLKLSAIAGTAPGTMVPFTLSNVNTTTDTITKTNHGLKTGERVVYHASAGALGGLIDGQSYFVVRLDDNSFQLVDSRAESFKQSPTLINLTSSGAGASHALEKPRIRIDTLAFAGTGAAAGSSTGGVTLAATGAGAAVINDIDNKIEAYIKDSTSIIAQSVSLIARDDSTIRADAGGVALGIAASASAGTTVSVSVGAALTENRIGQGTGQLISARIVNSTVSAMAGSVTLDARSSQDIGSFTIGGALSGAGSGSGVVVGGAVAGAVSLNTIEQTVESVIKSQSIVSAHNDVTLTALDSSRITADAGGVAASVAVGVAGISAAFSVGLAVSENTISNTVLSSIDTSKVTASQSIDLDAYSKSTIDAYAFGGAGALSVSLTTAAGSGAAAGAFTTNTITNNIDALITGSGAARPILAQNGAITLDAQDDSRINASSQGGSLAVSVSATPGSPTIAIALTGVDATNSITNHVRSRIIDSRVTSTLGPVRLNAVTLPSSSITSTAVAAAMTVAASGTISVALSGAGAGAYNTITNTVEASILGTSVVTTQDGVDVLATDSASIYAGTGAGALAVGLLSGSIGVSINTNTITNTITARIDGTVNTAGTLQVKAASTAHVNATSFSTSFAAATAGAGSVVTTTIQEDLNAILGPTSNITADDVIVQAIASQTAESHAKAATVSGGITVGVTRGNTTLKGTITASLQGTVTPLGDLLVEAVESGKAFTETWSLAGGVLGLSGAGGESLTEISPTVNASIDGGTIGTAASPIAGDVIVRSILLVDGDAKSFGVSFSPSIAAAGTKSVVTLNPQVNSYLGGDADVRTTGSIAVMALHNYRVDGDKLVADRRLSLAETESGSGTIVFSGAGADSTVNATPKLQTYVGTNAQAHAAQDITLLSLSLLETEARAKSTVVGLISVGQALTNANASGEILAYIDGKIEAGQKGSVLAVARHSALANATGFVVGIGAAETISISDVSPKVIVSVGRNSPTAELRATDASLIAISEAQSQVTSKSNIDGAGQPDESRSKPEVTLQFGPGSRVIATNRNFQMLEDPNVVRPEMTVADLLRPNTVRVLENTTYVATLTRTPFETETPTFSLKNERDGALFQINSTTGDLTFRTAPDFETPGDRNGDNLYEVPVVATYAKGNVVNMLIRVQVEDVAGFLTAESSPSTTTGPTIRLTDVTTMAAAAAARWKATGLSASQQAALDAITYRLDDLPAGQLALVAGNVVTLDRDANGNGWFVDATPHADEEFGAAGPRGFTASSGAAAGLMDLLTVLMHEHGHILGLAHAGSAFDVMFSALGVGTRRLPASGQAEGATPGTGDHPEIMYATGDNILSVSNLGTRYERVMADKEADDPSASAPVTRVKSEAAPKLKIEIGSEAVIQSGTNDEVVIRVESSHTATALGVNPDALFLIGIVEAEAKVGGSIEVSIGGNIVHAGSLTLELHSANQAIAIGQALAVGPLGGTGVKTTAVVEPTISTYVSPNSNIQVGGNFTIRTLAEDTALAISRGTAIGGGFAVGVGIADATIKPTISTYVDDGATITAGGNITIETLHNIDGEGNFLDRGAKAIAEASAGALVAGGGGATSTATASPEVSAYVHSGAKLTAGSAGEIIVRARSYHPAIAQSGGMGLGLAGVGVSLASATSNGKTSAYMDGKILGGGKLLVSAEAADLGLADTQAVSGGLLSGRGASSTTSVTPTVEAYLGANSETTVTGDVTVLANARPDGDARAIGFGGGGIDVGVSIAKSTVEPNVSAYIGQDARVAAGGNLSVLAQAGVPAPTLGDTLTPTTDVNPSEDTLLFPDHNLTTGDVVLYHSNGNTPIGGLTNGQLYPVLRVDTDRIQLGSNFDGALVEGSRDTIVFPNTHNLPDGTRVLYQTVGGAPAIAGLVDGQVYIVKVINPTTIKLQDPNVVLAPPVPFSSGNVEANDQTITRPDHGFAPNQAVTYRAPEPINFVSTAVDVRVNSNGTLPLEFLFQNIIEENNDAIYLGRDEDNNGVIEGHGLASGELVRYQATPTVDFDGDGILDGNAIGNLTSGDTYAVIKLNDYQIQLAELVETFDAATKVDDDDDFITVAGDFTTGDQIVYLAMGGTVIGGLADRGVYFVRTFGTNGIKLYNESRDAFLDQHAIDLTSVGSGSQRLYRQVELNPFKGSDADRRVVHSLSRDLDAGTLVDGQTYYVKVLNDDQFQLQLAPDSPTVLSLQLFGNGSSALHSTGTEGVDIAPSSGDHRLVVDLTSQPDGAHKLLGPGGISLRLNNTSRSDGISTATAKGSSGKIIGVEVNMATATGSATVQAYVVGNSTSGPGAAILAAAGDINIHSTSKLNLSSQINNGSGGFVAVGVSQATTDSDQANSAYVGDLAVLTAGKNFNLGALTTQSARSGAVAIGGGFIQVASASATTHIDYTTDVFVSTGAQITAGETLTVAGVSTTENSEAIANADARGFGAGTDANDGGRDAGRSVGDPDGRGLHIGKTNAHTETEIRGGAKLTAHRVELSATMPTVNARSVSTSFAGGLGADSDATARVENYQSTQVILRSNSEITGVGGVVIQSQATSTGTSANATATFRGAFGDTDSTAINDVGLTSTVITESDALVRAGGANPLALHVLTDTEATTPRSAQSNRFGIDIGEAKTLGGSTGNTDVAWSGDVVILGAAAPELHIDDSGTIVKAVGVTVNGGQSTGLLTGTDVSVDDITGSSGAQVLFDTNGGGISGSGGLWTFNNTAAGVTILNESDRRLVLNNISLLGSASPSVELRAASGAVSLQFAVEQTVAAATIDIRNLGESDILLNNSLPIESPLGTIRILNLGGSILAAGPNSLLRANQIELEAAEDIGSTANRLSVELIERLGHNEHFTAEAGRDLSLSITGRLRAPGSTLAVGIDSLRAGRDANILLQQSLRDTLGTGPTGTGILVTVPNDPYSDTILEYFRPDPPDATGSILDPVYFVDTSLAVAIDSSYLFGLLQVGRALSLTSASLSASAKLLSISATTQILGFGGGERIDAHTNGNLSLTHSGGNAMPIGQVESTTGSVDLLNPDQTNPGQDINLLPGGYVKAATTARLRAGDNITTDATSLLQAGTQFQIEGDALDIDLPGTTITLNGSVSSPLVLIDGGNDIDTFLLHNLNLLNAGLAASLIRVDGGGLRDYLLLNDSTDTGANSGSMTGSTVRGLGMGGDGLEYLGIDDLEIRLAQGGNSFDIRGTSATTKILGGSADDLLTVSSSSQTVADITGELTLDAAGGNANRLILDDSGSTTDSTTTFTNNSIQGFAPAPIHYSATNGHFSNPTDQNGIELRGPSSTSAIFNVQSTLENSTTRIVGNSGQDIFKVFSDASGSGLASTPASQLNGIRGDLSLVGGSGSENRLIVSDVADSSLSDTVVVTSDRITGLAPATLFYSARGHFTHPTSGDGILLLTSATLATSVQVQGTLLGSTTQIVTGQANDTLTVGNSSLSLADILGALTLDGGANSLTPITTLTLGLDSNSLPSGDQVTFLDQGDTSDGLVYDLSATTLSRSGFPTLTYLNLETVSLLTGSQSSTVNLVGTADNVNTTVTTADAPDVVNVISTGSGSNVVISTAGGDDAIYLNSTGAAGFTRVRSGLGNDLLSLGSTAAATPGLGSLDGLLGILDLDAGEGSANRLILDNSTGTPSVNAVWTTPVLGQLGMITGFAPATIYYAATAGAFHDAGNDGILALASTLGANAILIVGTLSNSTYQVEGGPQNDAFSIGDTHSGNQGNLNLIRGSVILVGNGGADSLVINDHGATGAYNYLITPTQVRHDSSIVRRPTGRSAAPPRSFAEEGIIFNATGDSARDTIASLRLDGTDQANTFSVRPSSLLRMTINGNRPISGVPVVGGGDYLRLDTSHFPDRIGGRKLHITSVGNGFWSFSNPFGTLPVFFESIERFNHVGIIASSADPGSARHTVVVRDAETGAVRFKVMPYSASYRGGFNSVVGDVNFDGLPDLITVAGANHAPVVRIYSLQPDANGNYQGTLLTSFLAFNVAFRSGSSLAIGDVNGDGAYDLILGAGAGWLPQVKVYNGLTLLTSHRLIGSPFNAFSTTFRGGVNVAAGDLNRDGAAEIVTAVAGNGPPLVNIYNGRTRRLMRSFAAFQSAYRGGMNVTLGDFNGDAIPEIILGLGRGAASRVLVFNGATILSARQPQLLRSFFPRTSLQGRPVRVKAYALNGGDLDFDRAFIVADIVGTNLTFYYSLKANDLFPRLPVLIRDGANQ